MNTNDLTNTSPHKVRKGGYWVGIYAYRNKEQLVDVLVEIIGNVWWSGKWRTGEKLARR